MAQTAMTVRMDNQQKAQFDKLCEQFGMSANTAINIFVKAVIRSKSIPFRQRMKKMMKWLQKQRLRSSNLELKQKEVKPQNSHLMKSMKKSEKSDDQEKNAMI